MANQQLVDYIKAQLAAGVTRPDIQRAAVGAKWPLQEIESAFAAAEGRAVAPAPVVQPLKPVAPVAQPVQAQPMPQEKPLPVIHMHPQEGLLRSPTFWSFAVFLVVAAVVAATYFLTPVGSMVRSYFAPAPAVTPVATTTPVITEQTYVDATYGFSVTYPGSLSQLPDGAGQVFALPNFIVSATTSPRVVTSCASTAKAATTTINGIDFTVKTATSTASTTMQIYSTVRLGACLTLGVLDTSATPILQSFRFIATSTPPAASTTVQQ